jgi:LDH2 family malate/lactate/ureidoglycolate dehydrogenase
MQSTKPSSGLLDEDRPHTVRLTVAEAAALGERALTRVGYSGEDARIIVDQMIDNMLCGYRFAGVPRILAIATRGRGSRAQR